MYLLHSFKGQNKLKRFLSHPSRKWGVCHNKALAAWLAASPPSSPPWCRRVFAVCLPHGLSPCSSESESGPCRVLNPCEEVNPRGVILSFNCPSLIAFILWPPYSCIPFVLSDDVVSHPAVGSVLIQGDTGALVSPILSCFGSSFCKCS